VTSLPNQIFRHLLLAVALVSPAFAAAGSAPHIALFVDATGAPRKIFHARMTIPAKPGHAHSLLPPSGFPENMAPPGRFRILPG